MIYLNEKDVKVLSSFLSEKKDTFYYFDTAVSQSKIYVEVCVYDNITDNLINVYNYSFPEFNNSEYLKIFPASADNSGDNLYGYLQIDTENLLKFLGYVKGNYKVTYKFYLNLLGTIQNRLFIRKISSSRKEIIVDYINKDLAEDYKKFTNKNFYRFSKKTFLNKFINLGNNKLELILNSKNQIDSYGNSLILKLYKPLETNVLVKDTFWIIALLSDEEYKDVVSIDFEVKQDPIDFANILKPPNFSKRSEYFDISSTVKYNKYTDLVDTSSFGEKLFAKYDAVELGLGIDLNIKYNDFNNFVHFGSATQMLQNFKNKLETIEYYNSLKLISNASGGVALSSSLYNKNKELEIISSFTPYENFLYYDRFKYFTSSLFLDSSGSASVIDATWPKTGTSITSSLYSVTSSQATEWFATMSAVAFNYDYNNPNALVKTLPEYILNDALNNRQYVDFINMIGEFYDNIWLYIISMERFLKRENKIEDGVPGSLIWNVLKNYGLNLKSGQNLIDLTKYKYGYYISSSQVRELEITGQKITQEIWNRILNNYPYILKTKGTEKSIRALLNCFGIPNYLIQIQEFGGPYETDLTSSLKKYSFNYEDFTFVLEMTGSQYIRIPWITSSYDLMKPDSIEFKVRTPKSMFDMDVFALTGPSGSVKLHLSKSAAEFGKFVLQIGNEIISSSVKPFYNNEFYSILFKRLYETDNSNAPQQYQLCIKGYDKYVNRITIDEIINLSTTSSATNKAYINSTDFYLGGLPSSTRKFYGAFDELRFWAEPLSDETFDFHAKYSIATNGNSITSSLNTLSFRLSFNDAYDLNLTSSLVNEAFNTSSYGNNVTASAVGFPALSYSNGIPFPFHFSDYERANTVEHRFISNDVSNKKIRIEKNYIEFSTLVTGSSNIPVYPLKGNYMISDYTPKGQIGEFDNSPPDVDLLLIGFNPTDFINRDIIAFFGNNDILSNYGDFDNIYKDYYPSNNNIVKIYWKNTKNAIGFRDYIKYIKTYDNSLFDILKELVPAKATTILGTVYTQNILRRNRTRLMFPEKANNYKQHLFRINQKEFFDSNKIIFNDLALETNLKLINDENFISYNYDELIGNLNMYSNKYIEFFDEIKETEIKCDVKYLISYNNSTINRQRINSDRFRIFSKGTKNSSLTSADRGPAVVIKSSNAKKLIVNYADNPKLIVK